MPQDSHSYSYVGIGVLQPPAAIVQARFYYKFLRKATTAPLKLRMYDALWRYASYPISNYLRVLSDTEAYVYDISILDDIIPAFQVYEAFFSSCCC